MAKKIKLMPDYHCHPLWLLGADFDNLAPDKLPLSQATVASLNNWAEKYNATLNEDYPPDSGFASLEDEVIFELEGIILWLQLRQELPVDYEVVYYSYYLKQIFVHPGDMKIWSSFNTLLSQPKSLPAYPLSSVVRV